MLRPLSLAVSSLAGHVLSPLTRCAQTLGLIPPPDHFDINPKAITPFAKLPKADAALIPKLLRPGNVAQTPVPTGGKNLIRAAQIEVIPGKPDLNFATIQAEIEKAKADGIEVLVLPEMSLPGYLIGDKWQREHFIGDCLAYNEKIRELSQGLTIVWGSVDADFEKRGENGEFRIYNAAFVARDGQWVDNGSGLPPGRTYKTLLPNYDKFDDKRYFTSLKTLAEEMGVPLESLLKPFEITVNGRKIKVGVIVCEDMWDEDYQHKPADILAAQGAELLLNVSASPWTMGKVNKIGQIVSEVTKRNNLPMLFVNQVSLQNNGKNEIPFHGRSGFYSSQGALLKGAAFFASGKLDVTDEDLRLKSATLSHELFNDRDIDAVFAAEIYAIRKFFKNDKKVLVGVSGGIDSALMLALLVIALGPERVYGVTMPSKFNSKDTQNDAFEICQKLGIHFGVMPIQGIVDETKAALEDTLFVRLDPNRPLKYSDIPQARGLPHNIWEHLKRMTQKFYARIFEQALPASLQDRSLQKIQLNAMDDGNVAARTRSAGGLAGFAAGLKAWFTNNGNHDETTVGYATIYGDVSGAAAFLADLPKAGKISIYALARYVNEWSELNLGLELIPQSIIDRIPSAELEKNQQDPFFFPYHSWLFHLWTHTGLEPEDILIMYRDNKWNPRMGDFHPEGVDIENSGPREFIDRVFKNNRAEFVNDIERWWKAMHYNYFKRIQAPPVFAIFARAFGFILREAQLEPHFTQKFYELKKSLF